MARRSNHYEWALERELLRREVPLVPVRETRMASAVGRTFKNFDFVVYRPGSVHLLLEVKGRKVARAGTVNCWVTKEDLANLDGWREAFGAGFEPVFAFVFALPSDEGAHFVVDDVAYEAWLVTLHDMQALSHERSPSWGTMTLGAADFKRVALPLLDEVSAAPAQTVR
ncbi:MAG: HYExAFE family protein [Planctomycetes bacterium]|nr:HYExAFE family protein [Planctomycetota bacterium]NUQ34527.1 HYExAFE family protein [Planctomycetaceae bacterium]